MAKKTTDAKVGVAVPASPGIASPASDAQERKYQAEEALRTLSRAEDHRADKKLMGDVASHAKEQAEKMSRIAGMVGRGVVSEKAMSKVAKKMPFKPRPKELANG